ncbi:hypothetical protein B0J15DRAFT_575229 [Fusarium solani]|uniref:Uncharacterized protein n=1 Tax=Fusarium solani TaxID=169388 RepID=A0A9P9G2P9_FUSSL|nr:uncharacterized protein B0J15DRAFT_575229 [Fusarium solani]KAH7230867.1 hypothetical protein B0J15DRAFT_575229 [Fusarium solani]
MTPFCDFKSNSNAAERGAFTAASWSRQGCGKSQTRQLSETSPRLTEGSQAFWVIGNNSQVQNAFHLVSQRTKNGLVNLDVSPGPTLPSAPVQKTLQAAVLTSDYAMQNVALRMNLNLIAPSLTRTTHIKN